MSENVFGSFMSFKVSKIRWKPEIMDDAVYFITGSADEEDNFLKLWYFPIEDADIDNLPLNIATLDHRGDVTGIQFVSPTKFICSSSVGSISMVECSGKSLSTVKSWDKQHYWKRGESAPCTDVSCFEEDIATVGEDGRIVLLTLTQDNPVRVMDAADSCPLQCVRFLKHNELVTGNLRGQLKIWDLRAIEDPLVSTFMQSVDGGCTTCLTNHPSQKHLLFAGDEKGSVTVWDLRKSTYPVNVLNAHNTSVSEIQFHPERPDHLFTCSFGGDIYQWNASRNIKDANHEDSPWWSSDATKHRMEIVSLLPTVSKPVNSLDVNRTRLLCGCDNEAIYLIRNLTL